MMSISGLVFLNAAQSYVILDILDYPRDSIGNASGTLAFAGELFCIPLVTFWGFVSDRVGRGLIMSLGLGIMGTAIFVYPFASCVFPIRFLSLFSSLLFFRLIFATGASATTAMITALIGDYAAQGGRAKVAAFSGTAAGLGALIAVLIFARLPIIFSKGSVAWMKFRHPEVVLAFTLTALILLMVALFSAFTLAKMPGSPSSNTSMWSRVKTGVMEIRRPCVALAYFSGFVARADSIALILFINPWIDNYMTKSGKCPPAVDPFGSRCEPAKRLASNLMSTSHMATLMGAPIFGILSDRLGPIESVAGPAVLGFFSFGMLLLAENPDSLMVYVAMLLSGLADIGMIVSSTALISSQSMTTERGALAGIFSLFGALGLITMSKLGGHMFDKISETAPFSITTIANGLLFVSLIVYVAFKKRASRTVL